MLKTKHVKKFKTTIEIQAQQCPCLPLYIDSGFAVYILFKSLINNIKSFNHTLFFILFQAVSTEGSDIHYESEENIYDHPLNMLDDWLASYANAMFLFTVLAIVIPFTYQFAQLKLATKALEGSTPQVILQSVKSNNTAALKQCLVSVLITSVAGVVAHMCRAAYIADGYYFETVPLLATMLTVILLLTMVTDGVPFIRRRLNKWINS